MKRRLLAPPVRRAFFNPAYVALNADTKVEMELLRGGRSKGCFCH